MPTKTPLTKNETEILGRLEFAVRRDKQRGGAGTRTTVDVAEYINVKTATARRILNKLCYAGLVDCFDYSTSTLSWRITAKGKRVALSSKARAEFTTR